MLQSFFNFRCTFVIRSPYLLPNYAHANACLFKHANHTLPIDQIKLPKIGSFIIGSYSSARASIYVPFRPRKRRISLPSKMHFLAQCLKIIKSLAKIQITKICLFSATERQLGLFTRFAGNVVKMRHFK